ncbi:MAG TPA: FHA domain-containing protein, partial [Ruminococcus sp.]|nr:FHA domain-containing protein [Ruminococcus sp.]
DEVYYPLNADEIIIGRHSAVDIRFSDMYVSRYHAIINVCNGTWSITDLNSSYGTFVNGQRIAHKRIYDNDEIQIGNRILVFKEKSKRKESDNE